MTDETAQGRLGLYLPPIVIKRLKLVGVERGKPVNTLVGEALALWWQTQPEGKVGPLFPAEASSKAAARPVEKEP